MILRCIIAAALLSAAASHPLQAHEPTVLINILSKQIRFVKEGGSSLSLKFPPGTQITGPGFIRGAPAPDIRIVNHRGALLLLHRETGHLPEGVYTFFHASPSAVLHCSLSSENRYYPLPLKISITGNDVEITVSENLHTYALHTAAAELGPIKPDEYEALYALTLLIITRAEKSTGHKNTGFDFCDLTHCQHYTGRSSASIPAPEFPAFINSSSMGSEPLFHSSCGGRTIGDRVFSLNAEGAGVKDRLFRESVDLCVDAGSPWQRETGADQLSMIISGTADPDTTLVWDRDAGRVSCAAGGRVTTMAAEDFRLRVNRVLGWNYLRSNNLTVKEKLSDSRKFFIFNGTGLGHGAGLCQRGALELSRRGFSRYEIIEHYFPGTKFIQPEGTVIRSPHFSFMRFNLNTGEIISISRPAFAKRKTSPGSIFKLFTALYLAKKRPDLFAGYEYNCRGREKDSSIHDHCWFPAGHGPIKISQALSGSCNLYFSSLNLKIDRNDFMNFCNSFCAETGIDLYLKKINDEKWKLFPAGLDDSFMISVTDFARLCSFIFSQNPVDTKIVSAGSSYTIQNLDVIRSALADTFITGTASGRLKRFGPDINSNGLSEEPLGIGLRGKTSTCIDGTNVPVIYGTFLGADADTGIIGILAHGNGHLTSRWCEKVMAGSY
jgi:hypothetical protein